MVMGWGGAGEEGGAEGDDSLLSSFCQIANKKL